jgi:predicted enzyme related to lactoylglutathione lyase
VRRADDVPPGGPLWANLLAAEPGRASDFYGRLFGWTTCERDALEFRLHDEPVAGCAKSPGGAERPDRWTLYLATPDVDATIERVVEAGGRVIAPAHDIGRLGRAAFVVDPGRAAVGLWEPLAHRGLALVAEPGAPCWFELHTSNYDACLRFYETALGWPVRPMAGDPAPRYATHGKAHSQRAGIRDTSALPGGGLTPGWTIFFGTTSCERSMQEIEALGGAVLAPVEESPTGRMVTVADPMGAAFHLVEVAAWPEDRNR